MRALIFSAAFGAAFFVSAAAEAEPDRDYWLGTLAACWPAQEMPGEGPRCDIIVHVFPDESECHLGNERAATMLLLRGSFDHEIPLVECLPFTVSQPGQPL